MVLVTALQVGLRVPLGWDLFLFSRYFPWCHSPLPPVHFFIAQCEECISPSPVGTTICTSFLSASHKEGENWRLQSLNENVTLKCTQALINSGIKNCTARACLWRVSYTTTKGRKLLVKDLWELLVFSTFVLKKKITSSLRLSLQEVLAFHPLKQTSVQKANFYTRFPMVDSYINMIIHCLVQKRNAFNNRKFDGKALNWRFSN